jgi:photosystem II stability/assembly factor-like uncharacterized protein
MNTHIKIKAIIACCFLLCLVSFQHTAKIENIKSFFELPLINSKMQVGDEDNPNARWEFEWLRTRDPQTNEIPRNIRVKEIEFVKNVPNRSQVFMKNEQGGASMLNTLNWDRRGPYNVGGRTRAMALDVTNESIIIAGGVSGGMWKSVNGGATWKKTTKPEQLHSVTAVAQDRRTGHTSTWYYGSGELIGNSAGGSGASFRGNGVYKSTDGGDSWTSLTSSASNTPQTLDLFDYVSNIVVNPLNGYVFVSLVYGLRRSMDGGETWDMPLVAETVNSPYVDISVNSKGVLYAALNNGGIWRSADNGDNWTNILPSNFNSSYNRTVIGHAPSDENTMYVIGDLGSDNHMLWKYTYISGDGSGSNGTWVDLSANIPAFGGLAGNFDSQGGYDLIIKVKPDDKDFVILGGTNVYRSSDGFSTTTNTKWIGGYALTNNYAMYENHHPDQHGFVFLPSDPNTAFSSHDGGISKTTAITDAAVTWTSLSNGYYTTQFYHVSIDQSKTKPDLVMGGLQDNGTWKSNVNSETTLWENVGSGDGVFSAIAFNAQADIWGTQNGRLHIYDYRDPLNFGWGYSWSELTPPATGMLFINPFVLNQANEKMLFYAGGSTIWRNNNIDMTDDASVDNFYFSDGYLKSNQWVQLTNAASDGTISALATSTSNPTHRLYYGDSQGIVRKLDDANSGNGASTDITGSSFPYSAYVSNIAVNPENGDEVMVTFSNYSVKSIFHTSDGGSTWSDISGNLEQNSDGSGNGPSVRSALIIKFKSTQMYFVGTSTGLYSTTSLNGASTTWVQESVESLGNVVVDALAGRQSDGYIAVATHGGGVYTVNFNSNPVIAAVSDVTIDEDATSTITLSATDANGDAITYSAVSDTNAVTVSVSSTTLTLTPNANWNGVATITAHASDGTVKDSTTFKLTVTPVNDIAAVDDVTIDEDKSTEVALATTFTGTTTFTAVSDSNAVTVSFPANPDMLKILPNANWNGVANIKAYVSDGTSKDSTSFKVTVTPVQDAPTAFDWVSSTLDTINITKTNTADIYGMEWGESIDVDGETVDYLVYAQIGVNPPEEVYDTTSTTVQLDFKELADGAFESFPMLARATVKFSVIATDGIDTVKVTGDDRVLFVIRYDYLSIESEGIPTQFALHENYPNPFNPTTTLRFDLPEVSDVTLSIYNMLGQKVKTFNMQSIPAGYHAIKWNGKNDHNQSVSGGVYIYKLQSRKEMQMRKMILLK